MRDRRLLLVPPVLFTALTLSTDLAVAQQNPPPNASRVPATQGWTDTGLGTGWSDWYDTGWNGGYGYDGWLQPWPQYYDVLGSVPNEGRYGDDYDQYYPFDDDYNETTDRYTDFDYVDRYDYPTYVPPWTAGTQGQNPGARGPRNRMRQRGQSPGNPPFTTHWQWSDPQHRWQRIDQGAQPSTDQGPAAAPGGAAPLHGQTTRASTLQGQVEAWTQKNLGDGAPDHTFVRLRLEDGTTRIVDLGPDLTIDDLGLHSGAHIMVRGPTTTIDGQPVLQAHRLRVEGQPVGLDWSPRTTYRTPDRARGSQSASSSQSSSEQRGGSSQTGQSCSCSGRIEQVATIDLAGESAPHTVARVAEDDGTTHLIDLGPHVTLSSVQQGDRVVVHGILGTIDDTPVMMITNATRNGEPLTASSR